MLRGSDSSGTRGRSIQLLLVGDDVPFSRNMPFDSSFFSTLRSRVPIVDAGPFLFCESVGHLVVKTFFLRRWIMSSGWCLAESGIETCRIDNVTPENGLSPPSPRPKNHPVWTRYLPHSQVRSHHMGTAGLTFWEKCQIALSG